MINSSVLAFIKKKLKAMFKLGDHVRIGTFSDVVYEVIHVKNNGLLYDLKRSFDVLVLKNIPLRILIPESY
ncbi:MAG TPA: hypothetical protein VHO90_01590 [Bacteroidales bacterium]|nr:hypothetical protein [Bacteroidales bacterium]